jgi:hypothetical protein
MQNPPELYGFAAELLTEFGWTKGVAQSEADGCLCAAAAIVVAAGLPPNSVYADGSGLSGLLATMKEVTEADQLLCDAATDLGLESDSTAVMAWNDRGGEDVIGTLSRLAERE